jgi:hypothetical protein
LVKLNSSARTTKCSRWRNSTVIPIVDISSQLSSWDSMTSPSTAEPAKHPSGLAGPRSTTWPPRTEAHP